ncbi:MAG TPA: hypothetical protein VET85_14665 [Stellaceae bacterium]|nr:hypothetical protein [Stellaceae bacterium]
MPPKAKRKTPKPKRKAAAPQRRAKKTGRRTARKPPSAKIASSPKAPVPTIGRDVVAEILLLSAKSTEGEQLGDAALSQVAMAAGLEPADVLTVHERLCAAADEADRITVVEVVELWSPEE